MQILYTQINQCKNLLIQMHQRITKTAPRYLNILRQSSVIQKQSSQRLQGEQRLKAKGNWTPLKQLQQSRPKQLNDYSGSGQPHSLQKPATNQ